MKITPVASPHQMADTGAQSNTQQDARSRAIAMLSGGAPAQVDQNNVTAEELPVAKPQSLEAAVETATEAPKAIAEPTAEETPISPQLALLARRERALRAKAQQQEQTFKQREDALRVREEELSAKPTFDQSKYVSKDQLRQNAFQILVDEGLDPNTIFEQYNNLGTVDPRVNAHIQKLEAKIESLVKVQEEGAKQAEEAQTQQYQQAVKQISQNVTSLVKSNPDQYEAIIHTGSQKDVVDLIEQTWKEEQRLMTEEEAADEVESYLVEQANKLARLKKIQKGLAPKAETEASSAAGTTPVATAKPKQPMNTLTNANSTTGKLSARQRAILAMEGKLGES